MFLKYVLVLALKSETKLNVYTNPLFLQQTVKYTNKIFSKATKTKQHLDKQSSKTRLKVRKLHK